MKQSDLDINNANSLSNQRATRSRRERIKLLQDEEKSALTGVLNTSDKREIKGYYEEQRGQISDISVGQAATDGNQDQLNNDISQDGVDTSVLHNGGGAGVGEGLTLIVCVNGEGYYVAFPGTVLGAQLNP
jgi:hypothetical protein